MPAPALKVSPSGSIFANLAQAATEAETALGDLKVSRVQATLSAFGAVVSSTCPGILHRAAVARLGIRRFTSLR